ncbi:hypothetical protein CHS0354_021136 [Potamilus streckersoni]|uniref:Thioredoxin domain-containing protein 12 n=1 Tax=Potamilus streckersoni TaxID=2493646 RepID=A0AAE0W6B7_9BIVA|nr:hypothetical protein CHS0354_021136 [Potamilus streckersoni]
MARVIVWPTFCFTFLQLISLTAAKAPGNGFGEDIEWRTLEDGLKEANELNKPLMLIIHKTWCGACKALKPKFAESEEIKKLSSSFLMVNVQDDDEPAGEKYSPDGAYIPRIFFLDPSGNVMKEFYNEDGNEKYKYFYPTPDNILKSMQKVLKEMPLERRPSDEL